MKHCVSGLATGSKRELVGRNQTEIKCTAAASRLCRGVKRPGSRINDRAFCRAAFRDEAVRQLPGAVQVDYALSRLPVIL